MQKASNILVQKLNSFIDKYYLNQVYKGIILTVSISLFALFLISFLEYFGRFNTNVRFVLLSSYILSVVGIIVWYLVRPAIGLFKLSRKLNHERAAQIIGKHFPEVNDKLLNALQLQSQYNDANNSLLLASIEQKTQELTPIPFTNAINVSTNKKYIKYALLPAIALFFVLVFSPGFKNSTERVVRYNQTFEKQAPFEFVIDKNSLNAIQNESVTIALKLKGEEIPEHSYIYIEGVKFKMKRKSRNSFEFEIPNVQNSSSLHFEAGGFKSPYYDLNIALKPSLLAYSANLIFPKYLKRQNETVSNMGELSIPQGTTIQWNFNTQHVDELKILPEDKIIEQENNAARFSKKYMHSASLKVKTSNKKVMAGDSLMYRITVIPDAFPKISLNTETDSFSAKILYFIGDIKDDYGFSKLQFNYTFENPSADRQNKSGKIEIPIDINIESQTFYYLWDLKQLDIQAEEEISYYFTVWDNDGVNGAKQSKTQKQFYKAPSLEEIKKQTEESNKEIKNSLSSAQSQADDLEKDIQKVEKLLTEKKQLDWSDKKKIEDMLKKHEELQKEIAETVKKNMEKNLKEEEFNPMSERLQEKQKKLEDLLDQVLDEEMKELMEKIRKLMEENRTQELQQEMEKLEFSEKEMNKELDRLLELFKELELEKKLEETIIEMNELAQKQKELAEKTEQTKGENEELKKEQEKLNQKMDDLEKSFKDIEEKNNALESPKDITPPESKREETKEDMNNASDKLDKGKNDKAAEDQKKAAEKMQEMANSLQEQMEEAYEEQQAEDIASLRQILENLIQLSFDQEEVQVQFKENRNYSPKYIELRQEQRRIKDDSKIVEDSLLALSKRVIEIEHFINEEIARINQSLDKSLAYLGERKTSDAMVHMQHGMTGYNNLALMLSQSLKNMQEEMKSQQEQKGQPKGQCKKPGNSSGGKNKKPNMNAIKKMQEELAKQLEQMKQGQKQGESPTSKQFAEMAAKQAAIRQKIRELERDLQKDGKGGSLGDLKKTQDLMDELERDLYYKQLNQNTMNRLNQIEIKLSEHEKAEKEQEQDNKRSSNEGQDQVREMPPAMKKYLEEKAKEQERLRQVSPELTPYYQQKVKDYFQR